MNNDKVLTIEEIANGKHKRVDEVKVNEYFKVSNAFQALATDEEDRMGDSTPTRPVTNEAPKLKKPFNLFFEVNSNCQNI